MLRPRRDDPSSLAVSPVAASRLKRDGVRFPALGGRPRRLVRGGLIALAGERERWPLWLPVGLGTGIAVYFALPVEPRIWTGPLCLSAVLLAGWRLRRAARCLPLALAFGSLALGFAAASLRTQIVAAPVLQKETRASPVTGRVVAVEPHIDGAGGARVVLDAVAIAGLERTPGPARIRVRLTKKDPVRLSPGDRIRLRAVLRPPPEPAMPGAFDFARRAFFQGLGAVGYAVGHAELLAGAAGTGGKAAAGQGLADLRQSIAERVLARVPGSSGAVAAALMTGERGAIPETVLEDMRRSGLAHLLAISGLHLGLVAGILFFAVRALLAAVPRLALNHPIKKWAACVSCAGALFYLLLVGATVPTQRAFLMLALVYLAVLLDRTAISLRMVAWAAVVVLLLAPESLLGASFQMSFAAVTGLVAAYELLRDKRPILFGAAGPLRKLGLYVAGVAFTSLIAVCATAPFAAYHFNRLAVFGLLANLIAVPLTAFAVMPLAILAFLLLPLGLEGPVLGLMGQAIDLLLEVAGWVAGLPGATLQVPAMPPVGLLVIVLGGLWLCLWRRRWRLLGVPVIVLACFTLAVSDPPDLVVSGDARLMAARDDSGRMWLSSLQRQRFEAGVWLRRAGETAGSPWPSTGAVAKDQLGCDPLACLFRKNERLVSLVRNPLALAEDCRNADLVVSPEPLRGLACDAMVIDRFDLWREGAHAIWLSSTRIRTESVSDRRGQRPWTRPRRPENRDRPSQDP